MLLASSGPKKRVYHPAAMRILGVLVALQCAGIAFLVYRAVADRLATIESPPRPDLPQES